MRDAKAGKLKAIVVSPNIDDSTSKGSLNDKISDLITVCKSKEVPVIYALSRRKLGKSVGKKLRTSVVAVLSADGANEDLKAALKLVSKLRAAYAQDPQGVHQRNIELKAGGGTAAAAQRKKLDRKTGAGPPSTKSKSSDRQVDHAEDSANTSAKLAANGRSPVDGTDPELGASASVRLATTEKAAKILGIGNSGDTIDDTNNASSASRAPTSALADSLRPQSNLNPNVQSFVPQQASTEAATQPAFATGNSNNQFAQDSDPQYVVPTSHGYEYYGVPLKKPPPYHTGLAHQPAQQWTAGGHQIFRRGPSHHAGRGNSRANRSRRRQPRRP